MPFRICIRYLSLVEGIVVHYLRIILVCHNNTQRLYLLALIRRPLLSDTRKSQANDTTSLWFCRFVVFIRASS